MNTLLLRVSFVCGVLLLLIGHKFIAPVMAGLILATGLSPMVEKFPLNWIRWKRLRKLVFILLFLSTYGALGTYILVTSAKTMARAVHFKNGHSGERQKSDSYSLDVFAYPPQTEDELTAVPDETAELSATDQDSQQPLPSTEPDEGKSSHFLSFFDEWIAKAKSLLQKVPGMNADEVSKTLGEILRGARNLALSLLSKIISAGPVFLIQGFVFLFAFILFFWKYESFSDFLHSFDSKNRGVRECVKIFESASFNTLMGTLVVGLAQGSIISIGAAAAGFESFVLLGLCAFFASYVPFFGTGVVWVSAVLYTLLSGDTEAAVVMGVAGAISSVADNLILPTFVGSQSNVNPLLLFIVVISLIEIIGIWGLLVGPVLCIFSTRVFELLYRGAAKG